MCGTPGRDLPPEDVRWIQRLFRYGFSWRKIRQTTGFSFAAIRRYMPAVDAEAKEEQRLLDRAARAEVCVRIRELRKLGWSMRRIGDEVGLNRDGVRYVLSGPRGRARIMELLRRQKREARGEKWSDQ